MASTLENALRLVKPGEMVVSLSDILDKLGNKITAEEREQLLIAMLSPRREIVQPGDLITSDLINQILIDVADLKIRVAKLSVGAVPGGPPEIIQLSKGSIAMGEELQVIGRNLDIANLVYVKIANVTIDKFKAGMSSSTLLVFDVPAIIGITDPGATVSLEIKNTSGAVSASLFVKPGGANVLNASFGFTVTAPAAPILANGSGDYTFSIDALTSIAEEYLVVPSIDAGWSAQATPTTLTIPKSTPTASSCSVAVRVTAPASGSATLKLELRPKNFPGKSYTSQNVAVAVGSNTGGSNPDFTLTSTVVFPGSAYVGGAIRCAANQTRNVTLSVTLAKTGKYLISAVATGPWTAAVQNSPNPITTTADGQSVDAVVDVTGPATAISAGTTGKLTITYQRQAPTTDSASFEFDLVPS